MDYLPGRKLYDVVQEEGTKYAARQGKTFAQLQKEVRGMRGGAVAENRGDGVQWLRTEVQGWCSG